MAHQEAQGSGQEDPIRSRRKVGGVDLRLLERTVAKLEAKIREIRRSFVDAIPDLVQPHNGRRLHPLTRRKILGTRSLSVFFTKLEKYVDLKTALGDDFRELRRYEQLLADLQAMRGETKRNIDRITESQGPEEKEKNQTLDHRPSARILPLRPAPAVQGDGMDASAATVAVKLKFIIQPVKFTRPVAELNINELRLGLRDVADSLKSRLFAFQNPNMEAALMQIKNPALFLRALEANGVNLREAIGDRHVAELEIYEKKRAEKLLRRENGGSIAKTPRRMKNPATRSINSLREGLRTTMNRLKADLSTLVRNPTIETELKQITAPASFFRTLEAHGFDLRKIIGPSNIAILDAYEKAREARDLDSKPLFEGSTLDKFVDALALSEERAATKEENGEIEGGNHHDTEISHDHGKNGHYGEFLRFWNQMRQIKPLTPHEEHDLFEAYEDGKINMLEQLSRERRSMRALLALCIPRRLYKTFSDADHAWYGFQFFTSHSPDFEEFDPFRLLYGEEYRVDNTLRKWLELEVENNKTVTESDGEEMDEDDEIIDFAVKWPEICRFIRQHGILYLKEFHKIEHIVARLRFRSQTVQRKGKDRYGEKTDPVGRALQKFVESPSEKSALQSIEFLWAEASKAENSPETLRVLIESFFEGLKNLGVIVPRGNIARAIQARLQAAEDPRRSIVDLFMKTRPSPDSIKALAHFSSHEDELSEAVETLLKMKQRILLPHLRNVCFSARFFIRRGAIPQVCIEAGTFGLMRAADTFDYRVGQRFYQYCWRQINEAINRGNWNERNQIHISNDQREAIERMRRAAKKSALRFGDESPEHVAEIAEMTEKDVREAMGYMRLNHMSSYETPASDNGDVRSLQDSLSTATTETPEDILARGEFLRNDLEDILRQAGLSSREEDILRRRYFDADDRDETLQQIGETYSLTRQRIQKIERVTLLKLRKYLKRNGLSAESFT